MKLKCFAVFDEKARAFLPPWFLPEVQMGVRAFGDCVNDATHAFGRHPADYTLFLIGEFDCSAGDFIAESLGKEALFTGLQCKVPPPRERGLFRDEATEVRGPLTAFEGSKQA